MKSVAYALLTLALLCIGLLLALNPALLPTFARTMISLLPVLLPGLLALRTLHKS